jgi:hypothetical protein
MVCTWKFSKTFHGQIENFEILGPAHNGGCPCYFVAMKKWCAVAKKKRGAWQQQTRSLWFHITNPETSDHYFIEWQSLQPPFLIRSYLDQITLWIYSLELSWFFSHLFNPTAYNPNSHFQTTHPTTNTPRWNHDSNNMVLQFLTSQKPWQVRHNSLEGPNLQDSFYQLTNDSQGNKNSPGAPICISVLTSIYNHRSITPHNYPNFFNHTKLQENNAITNWLFQIP